jgi:hypothetical protein
MSQTTEYKEYCLKCGAEVTFRVTERGSLLQQLVDWVVHIGGLCGACWKKAKGL